MTDEFWRIVKRSILLAVLLVIGASCSAFAQNKTIGFKPGAVLSQGRVVGNMLFVAGLKGSPAANRQTGGPRHYCADNARPRRHSKGRRGGGV